ncbi:Protein containing a U1-type Zn-finger and implicated in RNA splicing or processing [Ceraceosorus bombacis]|uniref:Protein containing a U1-type Zn-finger and implicated in RNA splicing or processing n=1 Tax=Ceraceosorus bombacis TaxID=401625 RepID=A0A0P1BL97_9BASI|nr:Protein containing a U1-type Zn-finger and implicated in RNA splicing or processing [Ceraceosorus bombacis]
MPRAEAGSIKAVSNSIKAKGLTKLRFYCQICSKACRDENGYKNHIESESHLRQIAAIGGGSNAAKTIDRFSDQFQKEFVALLSRRFGTRRVRANQVYQEYIQERHHLHMNATQWQSLSQFVKHLGREGIVRAEENEKGWWIEWVDNSPAALARQDALLKMNRAKVDEETRERKFLKEQIERARAGGGGGEEEAKDAEQKQQQADSGRLELQRDGNAPIKIAIGLRAKVAEGEADIPMRQQAHRSARPRQPSRSS